MIENNPHIRWEKGRILTPAPPMLTEGTLRRAGRAYRVWQPRQSKLAAALMKGLTLPLPETARILYLGAASGTTISHLADITPRGMILAVEFARIPYAQLHQLVRRFYPHVIPLLRDARIPHTYADYSMHFTHIIQDIAQPDQVRILYENARLYADTDTIILLSVKARSIDATRPVRDVYRRVDSELRNHFTIHWQSRLEPYEQDHAFYKLSIKT